MTKKYDNHPISAADAAVAYLIAVTSATLVVIILLALISTSLVSNRPLVLCVIVWVIIFLSALIPYVAGIVITNRQKISHWAYFVVGGLLVSIALCFALISIPIPQLGINAVPPEPTYWRKFFSALAIFTPAGVIAGAICWWSLCLDNVSANLDE